MAISEDVARMMADLGLKRLDTIADYKPSTEAVQGEATGQEHRARLTETMQDSGGRHQHRPYPTRLPPISRGGFTDLLPGGARPRPPQNPNRAPDPREKGKVRFIGNERVEIGGGRNAVSGAAPVRPPHSAASTTTPLASGRRPGASNSPTRTSKSIRAPTATVDLCSSAAIRNLTRASAATFAGNTSNRHPDMPAASNSTTAARPNMPAVSTSTASARSTMPEASTSAATARPRTGSASTTRNPARPTSTNSSTTAGGTRSTVSTIRLGPTTRPSAVPAPTTAVYGPWLNIATYYVPLEGTEEFEEYYAKYPDRLAPYHAIARAKLIKVCIDLIKDGDARETRRYGERLPKQKWMVEAAALAKEQVENLSEKEIQEYCDANPGHIHYIIAAKDVFVRNDERTDSPLQLMPAPVEESAQQVAATTVPSSPLLLLSSSPLPSSPPAPNAENTLAIIDTAPASDPPAATTDGHAGWLASTFRDSDGHLLGADEFRLNGLPVQITVTVAARAPGFDTNILRQYFRDLGNHLQSQAADAVGGARVMATGLWVEDEDEEL